MDTSTSFTVTRRYQPVIRRRPYFVDFAASSRRTHAEIISAGDGRIPFALDRGANVWSSEIDGCLDGWHAPVIDLDFGPDDLPAAIDGLRGVFFDAPDDAFRFVNSTEFHHAYVEWLYEWGDYAARTRALAERMIETSNGPQPLISTFYAEFSLNTGATSVRLPGHYKTDDDFANVASTDERDIRVSTRG